MLRICPYTGVTPVTYGLVVAFPHRTGVPHRPYSGLICPISGTSRWSAPTSSSRSWIERPSGKPWNGFVVFPPNTITMPSPSPRALRVICTCSPTPNASSTTTATVPQVIPSTVSAVRSRCVRTSSTNWSSRARMRMAT